MIKQQIFIKHIVNENTFGTSLKSSINRMKLEQAWEALELLEKLTNMDDLDEETEDFF